MKHTESSMIELLRRRYTLIRKGTDADRFVRASHVRMPGEMYSGEALRIADYMVIDTYKPHDIHGFEIKVSRSDWLSELRDIEKSEAWMQYCSKWWLVVSDKSIVRGDLPEGWGLMAPDTSGKLRAVKGADRFEPVIMPANVLGQLSRSIAKTARREFASVS